MRIYVCITGDLFHIGHISFLKEARKFGDYLIVGVCSDDAVAAYKRPPVMKLSERLAVIDACRYVDATIPAAPAETTKEFICKHGIDMVVATQAYSAETLQKYYKDPIELQRLSLVPYHEGISTTQIIRRCHSTYLNMNGALGQL